MHAWSKFWLLCALAVAMSACGPLSQLTPPSGNVPQSATPAVTETATATPLPVTTTPAPPISSIKMIDADKGWAWTGSGRLLHSSDGGGTWVDRTPEGQIMPYGFFPLDAQTAWLPMPLTDSGMYDLLHSTDDGLTWMEYPNGPASGLEFRDALNGWAVTGDVGAGNVYFSLSGTSDGGKTWAPIPARAPTGEEGLPPGTIHLCNICNDSFFYEPGRMIIINGDLGSMESTGVVRLQISFDLGNTWQVRNLVLPEALTHALVAGASPTFFDDKNGLLAVNLMEMDNQGNSVSHQLAFYITRDGGAEWSLLPGTLESAGTFPQLQVVSPQDLFALCSNALCASHDGAHTWQTLTSNLDFTQNDSRSVSALDFISTTTGWALIMENDTSALYKTIDGGTTWSRLAPMLAASPPVKVIIDTSVPTPTLVPTPTSEPTPTPGVVFDPQANAERIRFAPNATWIEINATSSANTAKRYILSAMQNQIMSVSIPQGPAYPVHVIGVDKKPLGDSLQDLPFWRGTLPSTQDYVVEVDPQVSGPFTLRIAINPPGQASQVFGFSDPRYPVALSYSDEFAPTDVQIPVNLKGTPLLTLDFINPSFYSPRTNLSEAYLLLAASTDPAIVSTCTQPSTQNAETVTGLVSIGNQTFTRSEFSGAAAGNRYDQVAYRTVWENQCFELIFLIHSTNIGNYPPGTVVEFDRAAVLAKFEAILNSFLVK